MKFSEISSTQWDELQPYLDTCLFPVTGMDGTETPPEATMALERLRDLMDLIEIPFKGRVVTYPACHYAGEGDELAASLRKWMASLRKTGFRYIIIVTTNTGIQLTHCGADAVITSLPGGELPSREEVSNVIRSLWNGKSA